MMFSLRTLLSCMALGFAGLMTVQEAAAQQRANWTYAQEQTALGGIPFTPLELRLIPPGVQPNDVDRFRTLDQRSRFQQLNGPNRFKQIDQPDRFRQIDRPSRFHRFEQPEWREHRRELAREVPPMQVPSDEWTPQVPHESEALQEPVNDFLPLPEESQAVPPENAEGEWLYESDETWPNNLDETSPVEPE